MDRMRESVFAVLGDLYRLSFLDLFSGSGIIALEAASRGAEPIEAVEMDPLKRKTLLKNSSIAPVRINCRFIAVELYIKRAKEPFDIVFCDPPFPYKFKGELIRTISASPLLPAGSRLLVHRPREEPWKELPDHLILENSRTYGRSVVDFFRAWPGICGEERAHTRESARTGEFQDEI
jgi:16S rRNA (guanine(966)-N(2))-methyltransferase RsmD